MTDSTARLFLITPPLTGAPGERAALAAALATGGIACVLVRTAARDERSAKALLREIGPGVQRAGAALLVEGDPRLAAHVQADGVEIRGVGDALEAAVESLKPDRIVGVSGLASRDDAMRAGECDVDYLMFGEPAQDGSWPDPGWTLERIGWWAEIFNVPCVGFAATLGAVGPLAAAGAEFVALGAAVFDDPRGAAAAVGEALEAVRRAAAARETAGP